MALIKFTKLNGDLIRNLPPELRNELIVFEDVIPDGIMTSLYVNDPYYKKERSDFLNHRDDVREKMYRVRGRREELSEKQNRAFRSKPLFCFQITIPRLALFPNR